MSVSTITGVCIVDEYPNPPFIIVISSKVSFSDVEIAIALFNTGVEYDIYPLVPTETYFSSLSSLPIDMISNNR